MIIWNLFLMLLWASLAGDFSAQNLIIGFLVGYVLLGSLARRGVVGRQEYNQVVPKTIGLIFYFSAELIKASVRIAIDIIRPGFHFSPGFISVPLDVTEDYEITLLATLISVTPGTLTIDVSEDKSTLYVHCMYLNQDTKQETINEIKGQLERRLIEILR